MLKVKCPRKIRECKQHYQEYRYAIHQIILIFFLMFFMLSFFGLRMEISSLENTINRLDNKITTLREINQEMLLIIETNQLPNYIQDQYLYRHHWGTQHDHAPEK